MKRVTYLLVLLICSVGCINKEIGLIEDIPDLMEIHDIERALQISQNACGHTSMSWLYDLLTKAEEDRRNMMHKGNYIGIVAIIEYRGQPAFYTNFGLGSGGIAYYLFDCNGKEISGEGDGTSKIPSFDQLKKEQIIYSTI